jgi:glycerophosphoryl diester phosphodiesterase
MIAFIKPSIKFFTLLIVISITNIKANSANAIIEQNETEDQVVVNSYSFNAEPKQRSNFTIAGQTEKVVRGLTIIHFNTSQKFEHRTYDTYVSWKKAEEFVSVVKELQSNNATFIILSHDSAVKQSGKVSSILKKTGLPQLSAIENRQAYVMHNINGKITETINDLSVTIKLEVPGNIIDKTIYFPRERYEFEPSVDRYIAHAGGEVNGTKSTNTKQALNQNYERGFRLFELDIIKTSDDKYVAAHDWNMWSRFTEYKGELPPTHAEFMKRKIYGDYETLDMDGINEWFAAHPDATLITDKVNKPLDFANKFIDKDRLKMELFNLVSIEEASRNGIEVIISQKPFFGLQGDKFNFLEINNIKHIALSRRKIASQKKLLLKLKDKGIKVYVYHVNFDSGKDEKYVQEYEIGLVYGMYADKWAFDTKEEAISGNVFVD